jgi:hypothetical protein
MKAQRGKVKKPGGKKSSQKPKPKKKKRRASANRVSMMESVLRPLAGAAAEILAQMRR